MLRHTGERGRVFIFMFGICETVVISILLTVLAVRLWGISFFTVSVCVCLSTYSAHPCAYANSYALAHPRHFQGVKWWIAHFLCSCKEKEADQCLIRLVMLSHSSLWAHMSLILNPTMWCMKMNLQSLFSAHTHTHSHTVYTHTMQVSDWRLVRWWILRRLR